MSFTAFPIINTFCFGKMHFVYMTSRVSSKGGYYLFIFLFIVNLQAHTNVLFLLNNNWYDVKDHAKCYL